MCTVGGPVDIEPPEERIKATDYRCNECNEKFRGIGRHPVCPCCQSEDVIEV